MVSSGQIFAGTVLLILCLCFFAGAIFRYHKRRKTTPISFTEILVFLNKVHIGGLRKLVDPLEEAYVRGCYNRSEFRDVQAVRIAAAREYFRKMVANAVALQNFGYRHLAGGDDTKRWLAHRLINLAVPVKMMGRGGICALFLLRRLRFLDRVLLGWRLPILRYLVEETLESYHDLKLAALVLARYSEKGIEVKLYARL
jgi:hypothetical protein